VVEIMKIQKSELQFVNYFSPQISDLMIFNPIFKY